MAAIRRLNSDDFAGVTMPIPTDWPISVEWNESMGALDNAQVAYGGFAIPAADVKPLTFYAKGVRWPWYPALRGTLIIEERNEEGFTMRSVGPMTKGRVGIREWLKCHLGKRHAAQ